MADFPVDNTALDRIEHAMKAALICGEDGNPEVVNADYTINDLLHFYSGYDQAREVPTERIGVFEYTGFLFHEKDIIASLIAEVRRLRAREIGLGLPCSQCGKTLADEACGPTHALLWWNPSHHREFEWKDTP